LFYAEVTPGKTQRREAVWKRFRILSKTLQFGSNYRVVTGVVPRIDGFEPAGMVGEADRATLALDIAAESVL
jgi:hypothetical protein